MVMVIIFLITTATAPVITVLTVDQTLFQVLFLYFSPFILTVSQMR